MASSKSTKVPSKHHDEKFNKQKNSGINVKSRDKVIQFLNIQLMNMSKMDRYIESAEEISFSTVNLNIVQKFMEVYNHNQKKSAKTGKTNEQHFDYEPSKPRTNNDIDCAETYCCRKKYNTRIEKSETSKPEETKLSEFIIFFVLKNESQEITNIFAATTGGAWNVVRSCINHTFPVTIIEQVGSANKIKSIERHSLFENDTRKEVLYQLRHVDLYQSSSLYYLVINITCEIDDENGKELLNLLNKTPDDSHINSLQSESDRQSDFSENSEPPDKRPKTNENTAKQPKVEIPDIKITTAGSLTILKELKTEDYFDILKLFERYLSLGRPPNNNFHFLHFFTTENQSELDDALLEDMFYRYQPGNKKEQSVALRHKYFEDFFLSKKFELKIPPQKRFEDIGSEAPSINTIMEKIEADNIDFDEFKTRMKTGKLRFFSKKKDTTACIIQCIEGEIFFEGQHYFKIRSTWYRLSVDYLSLLQQDFEKAMDELFIKKDEEGSLPLRWIRNNPFNQAELQKLLNYSDAEINELMKKLRSESVSYISEGQVKQDKLIGEILEIHAIKKYQKEIEYALSNCLKLTKFDKDYWDDVLEKRITSAKNEELNENSDKESNQQQRKKRRIPKKKAKETPKKDLDTIWRELNKKRYVLVDKSEKLTFVKNPFPYPLEKEKNYETLKKFLTVACEPDQLEDDYNISYLDIDATENEPKYLVFDTICPDGIESCDILRYTHSNLRYSNDSLYLYHIKEEFGQNTRDVCSQILNSAIRIQEALRTNQGDNYLKRLWDKANKLPEVSSKNYAWRKELKDKLEAIGENNFVDMFRFKDIVFVYAYLTPTGFKKSFDRDELPELISSICEKLQFINKYGFLTSKFFHTTQKKFIDEILKLKDSPVDEANCKAAFDILCDRGFSRSTIGKMELIRLAEKLKSFQNRFKFKICDIRTS